MNIIIVNCNNIENLKSCIGSIKDHTAGDYKIIVVDQNSKDGSLEWLRENVGHIVSDRNRHSRSYGKNKAIDLSNSEWIALIDSDIVITDDAWLDKMWNYTNDNRTGVVEAEIILADGQKTFAGLAFCLIRRKCFDDVGHFDSRLGKGYELDWLTRLEWSNWRTDYCSDIIAESSTGRGLTGCMVYDMEHFRQEVLKLLGFKYSMNFLENTLIKNVIRRNKKGAKK